MDRDKRWERVQNRLPAGGWTANGIIMTLACRGWRRRTPATKIDESGQTHRHICPCRIDDGDVVLFMNRRPDRAMEFTKRTDPAFDLLCRPPAQAGAVCLGDQLWRGRIPTRWPIRRKP